MDPIPRKKQNAPQTWGLNLKKAYQKHIPKHFNISFTRTDAEQGTKIFRVQIVCRTTNWLGIRILRLKLPLQL